MSDTPINENVRKTIGERLDKLESERDVRIVFACESGSRAWGFESVDSDYDVRFLYVRQRDWYLTIDFEDQSDVIETPIDGVWDITGWDFRKALRLLRKSNPVLLEWLHSPVIYRESGSAASRLRDLVPSYFSTRAALHHYRSMALKNYRAYLQEDVVRRKKYFYALRPLLACKWLEQDRGPVPMEFSKLVDAAALPGPVVDAIIELLEEKRGGMELETGPRIGELNDLIEAELGRLKQLDPPHAEQQQNAELLNRALLAVLSEGRDSRAS